MKAKMGEAQGLLTDDLELLLRDVEEFCSRLGIGRNVEQDIPDSVENYLLYVAQTGNTIFPWQSVRPLYRYKLRSAIDEFQGESSPIEPFVFERFDLFRSAPFTIQRISELITSPTRHYKIKDKFVSALEKSVFVVSTIEPNSPFDDQDKNFKNGSGDMSTPFEECADLHTSVSCYESSHISYQNNQQQNYYTSAPNVRSSSEDQQSTKSQQNQNQTMESHFYEDPSLLLEVKSVLDDMLEKIMYG